MKTTLYAMGLLVTLLLVGCSDEEGTTYPVPAGNSKLVACIEGQDVDARTAVDDEGNVTWSETDKIGVFGSKTFNAPFTSTGKGGNVAFVGDLASSDDAAEWAYYPYTEDAEVTDDELTFTLPAEYTYTGNSHAPMLGTKDGNNSLTFKHLTGLIRITLGDMPDDADRFVITSAGDNAPPLVGKAVVNIQTEDAILRISESGSNSITYTLGSLADGEKYRSFFVPVPVGEYTLLEVSLYGKDKQEPYFTRTISNLKVKRATMVDMSVLDGRTGAQYVLSENTIEITEELATHVEVSGDDNTTLTCKDMEESEIPQVGHVIWAKVTDDFPNGFLGKVKSVTKNGDGTYRVETEPAALGEAFDELYVNETVSLETAASPRSRPGEKVFGFDITHKIGVNLGWEDSPVELSGNIKNGFEVMVSIILDKKRKIERAAITLIHANTTEFALSVQGGTLGNEDPVETSLGKMTFKSIPLAYGIIQLTPEIEAKVVRAAKGEITLEANFNSKTLTYTCAEFEGGQWKSGQTKPGKSTSKSPWSIGGELVFSGEVGFGFIFEAKLKLYNREDMKIGLDPQLNGTLSGEVKISSSEESLIDAKLETYLGISGKATIDATLLTLGKTELECEFTFAERPLLESEIYLLPFFKDLLATPGEGEWMYKAGVTTEASRELISKETQIYFETVNENGEVVHQTKPVPYYSTPTEEVVGQGNIPVFEPVPFDFIVDSLQTETCYKTYPVVQSPLLERIVWDGKVKLESLSEDIFKESSLRKQLIQMYKDTDGDNWTNNENWCSDRPIEEWYGISRNYDNRHLYDINLGRNNLKGTCKLSSDAIYAINVGSNQLSSLDASGCISLKELNCSDNQLTSLDVSGCTSLYSLSCSNKLVFWNP